MFLVLLLLIAGTLLHFNLTIFNCYVSTCVAMTLLLEYLKGCGLPCLLFYRKPQLIVARSWLQHVLIVKMCGQTSDHFVIAAKCTVSTPTIVA